MMRIPSSFLFAAVLFMSTLQPVMAQDVRGYCGTTRATLDDGITDQLQERLAVGSQSGRPAKRSDHLCPLSGFISSARMMAAEVSVYRVLGYVVRGLNEFYADMDINSI